MILPRGELTSFSQLSGSIRKWHREKSWAVMSTRSISLQGLSRHQERQRAPRKKRKSLRWTSTAKATRWCQHHFFNAIATFSDRLFVSRSMNVCLHYSQHREEKEDKMEWRNIPFSCALLYGWMWPTISLPKMKNYLNRNYVERETVRDYISFPSHSSDVTSHS